MGIFDDAWREACMKKRCKYCTKNAEKWKGGTFYCKDCYDKAVVKGMRLEFSEPPPQKKGGSENSKVKVSKKKINKITVDKYKIVR